MGIDAALVSIWPEGIMLSTTICSRRPGPSRGVNCLPARTRQPNPGALVARHGRWRSNGRRRPSRTPVPPTPQVVSPEPSLPPVSLPAATVHPLATGASPERRRPWSKPLRAASAGCRRTAF